MASTGTAVIFIPIEIYGTYIHIETLDLENIWYMHNAQICILTGKKWDNGHKSKTEFDKLKT